LDRISESPAQANEIYSRIFSDINRRYLVGYYPTNKEHDGKRRKVAISVREHPEYIVMGRKAYYAQDRTSDDCVTRYWPLCFTQSFADTNDCLS